MRTNANHRTHAMMVWMVIATMLLASLACRSVQRPADQTPTPSSTLTLTPSPTQMLSTPLASTTPSALPATSTPVPTGKVIDCTGDVQEIHLAQKANIIVVSGVNYQVPQEILVVILPHLHIGAHIQCTAKANLSGVIIIVNVVKIDNVVIVINPPKHEGGDEDEDEDED